MLHLTGLERVNKALNLEEPDTVPHFEGLIEPKVREAILPGCSYEDFIERMDLDAIVVIDRLSAYRFETVDAGKNIKRDQWGGLIRYGQHQLGVSIGTAFKSEQDIDGYTPPDPDEPWRYKTLEETVKRFKGQRAVIAMVNDVFNVVQESLLDPFNYFEAMVNRPHLVDRLNEIVLNYDLKYIKNCIEVGADAVLVGGDYAMTKGPMVSPKHTERFLIPSLRKMVELAHSYRKPIIKHSDGNIWKIIKLIVDTGINGLHPIDVIAGMDIGEVKKQYGSKVCLIGNVNCGPILCSGSLDEVRQAVRDCMMKAGFGGGYICASSNIIHSGVKAENYVAMVKAIREYGKYPLALN